MRENKLMEEGRMEIFPNGVKNLNKRNNKKMTL